MAGTDEKSEEQLISETTSEGGIFLKRKPIAFREIRATIITGLVAGVSIGTVIGLGFLIWFLNGGMIGLRSDRNSILAMIIPLVLVTLVVSIPVIVYNLYRLFSERRGGFLRIGRETFEFNTGDKSIMVPMNDLLGIRYTGDTKFYYLEKTYSLPGALIIWYLTDSPRGFDFLNCDFTHYFQMVGPNLNPGIALNRSILEELTRRLKSRKESGLPTAGFPAFQFEATTVQPTDMPDQNLKISEFACDGSTVRYSDGDKTFDFPIHAIKSITRLSDHIYVMLDDTCKEKMARIDFLKLSNPDEIVKYFECMSSLFLPVEIDDYWGDYKPVN